MNSATARGVSLPSLTQTIIGCAIRVHSKLGPGLLESTYEACLIHELQRAGLEVKSQVALPVIYEGVKLELGYRIDLLIEDCVVIEIKAIEGILPVHKAQVLSYLRLSDRRVGLLLNFNVTRMKEGIYRIVNGPGLQLSP